MKAGLGAEEGIKAGCWLERGLMNKRAQWVEIGVRDLGKGDMRQDYLKWGQYGMDTTNRPAARHCQILGENSIRKEADMEQDTSDEMEDRAACNNHKANSSMMGNS